MYQKILLAYDGSREGREALLKCAEIAHLLQAQVHLLAVMRMPSGVFLAESFVPDTILEDERQRIQEIVDEGVALLVKTGGEAVGHLRVGEPVEEICQLAHQLAVDLIVVGHRRGIPFAARWWQGSSVGVSLLECAPCSILVTFCQ